MRLIGAKHVVQKEEQCTQLLDVGGSDALAGGVEAIVMAPLGLVQSSRKQLRSSNSTALHEDLQLYTKIRSGRVGVRRRTPPAAPLRLDRSDAWRGVDVRRRKGKRERETKS